MKGKAAKPKDREIPWKFQTTDPEAEIRDAFIKFIMTIPIDPNVRPFMYTASAYAHFKAGWQAREKLPR